MRRMLPLALLGTALAGCNKELPLCGDPVFGRFVSFKIVDDATGRDWFAQPGRPPGDSLRLLTYSNGLAQYAVRIGSGFRLGPAVVVDRSTTLYLRFSRQDVDTVVVHLRHATLTGPDPCGYGPALEELDLTYNGRPAGTFRASAPADSLSQVFDRQVGGRLVTLRKRP